MLDRNQTQNAGAVDVVATIDSAPLSRLQIRVIMLCGLVALLDGYDAQSIAFVASPIAAEFQTPMSDFGPVFASALAGLTIGALLFGAVADRFGRRWIVIGATLAFGAFTIGAAQAGSLTQLMLYRFLTGVGLGGAMPNIISLTAEFAPRRLRALLVTIMFAGFPLGAVFGGLLSAGLVPSHGWRAVFWVGGGVPLALVPVLLVALPESVRVLAANGRTARVVAILRQIAPDRGIPPDAGIVIREAALPGMPVRHLFTEGRIGTTLLLWAMVFANLLLLFFMYNWLPALLGRAGLPLGRAMMGTVMFNLGGIAGGLLQGRLIDRFGAVPVLATAYALAALLVGAFGLIQDAPLLAMVAIFGSGACAIGGQFGANAVAAGLYPTSIRATGVGWALGIGRIGSIVGPVLGGIMLSLGWGLPAIFAAAAIPALAASAAVIALGRVSAERGGMVAVPEPVVTGH